MRDFSRAESGPDLPLRLDVCHLPGSPRTTSYERLNPELPWRSSSLLTCVCKTAGPRKVLNAGIFEFSLGAWREVHSMVQTSIVFGISTMFFFFRSACFVCRF